MSADPKQENSKAPEQDRYALRRHEPDDGWAWEVWDAEEKRAVALCTFHVGAKAVAKELNVEGFTDA